MIFRFSFSARTFDGALYVPGKWQECEGRRDTPRGEQSSSVRSLRDHPWSILSIPLRAKTWRRLWLWRACATASWTSWASRFVDNRVVRSWKWCEFDVSTTKLLNHAGTSSIVSVDEEWFDLAAIPFCLASIDVTHKVESLLGASNAGHTDHPKFTSFRYPPHRLSAYLCSIYRVCSREAFRAGVNQLYDSLLWDSPFAPCWAHSDYSRSEHLACPPLKRRGNYRNVVHFYIHIYCTSVKALSDTCVYNIRRCLDTALKTTHGLSIIQRRTGLFNKKCMHI
jgi:hypothetical protein